MLSTNVPMNLLCIILNPNNAKAEMTDHGTHIFKLCFGKAKERNNNHGFYSTEGASVVYEAHFQPFILTA